MSLTNGSIKYLLSIYELTLHNEETSCAKIALMLSVYRPSVTRMINTLVDNKLVYKSSNKKISLTNEGHKIAKRYMGGLNEVERVLNFNFMLNEKSLKEIAFKILAELPENRIT